MSYTFISHLKKRNIKVLIALGLYHWALMRLTVVIMVIYIYSGDSRFIELEQGGKAVSQDEADEGHQTADGDEGRTHLQEDVFTHSRDRRSDNQQDGYRQDTQDNLKGEVERA